MCSKKVNFLTATDILCDIENVLETSDESIQVELKDEDAPSNLRLEEENISLKEEIKMYISVDNIKKEVLCMFAELKNCF